ncbi:MAG: AMP-binding protein, partial [Acidobacteriota bacterium]
KHGHDPITGKVTLMLHTFLGEDKNTVREKVRVPFTNYLRSSIGLIANLIKSLKLPFDLTKMDAKDMGDLLAFAFDRYFETSALFGTPTTCYTMISRLKELGVNEVACLIDFGVDVESTLAGLQYLNLLRKNSSESAITNSYSLSAQAEKYPVSLMQCTPSLMKMLSFNQDNIESLKSLHTLMLGGEALPLSLTKQLSEMLPARIINMYGPTETTIWSATQEIDKAASVVSIGHPITNTQIYILDEYLQSVPLGVVGELYIGGDGLARGYFNHPDITADRFLPNPFSNTPGTRLYRTGDLARYLANGGIEFLGRTDYQVKIRGHRIELGEIVAVLEQHANVREAVVLAKDGLLDDKQLVAYLIPKQQPAPTNTELQNYLKQRLPEYMVPTVFLTLTSFPLTANGKIDRNALLRMESRKLPSNTQYVAPRSRLEQIIASVWQQVLNLEKVGIHDNFFDLGGHSLLIAQAQSQLKQLLHRDLPLIKILEHPTINSLAKYLEQDQSEQLSLKETQDRAKKQRESIKRHRQSMMRIR